MSEKLKYNYSGDRRGMSPHRKRVFDHSYLRPAYNHILNEYLDNQRKVILDRSAWLWLSFKDKKARFGYMSMDYNEPATIWEYIEYMRNYHSKGVKSITFKELKSVCNFDGRRRKNRIYALIPVDSLFLFSKMLRNKLTIEKEFDAMLRKLDIYNPKVLKEELIKVLEKQIEMLKKQIN